VETSTHPRVPPPPEVLLTPLTLFRLLQGCSFAPSLLFLLASLLTAPAAVSGAVRPEGFLVFLPPGGDLSAAPHLLAEARAHPDPEARVGLYGNVEALAGARLELEPEDVEARWWRLAAWGLLVDDSSSRGKIRLARAIHQEARWILERDPHHPGAHHAMGRLHAGVLRLNGVLRFLALRLAGEKELRGATWEGAEWHLREAIRGEPHLLVHRYELAGIYQDQGRTDDTLREVEALLALPDSDPMDPVVRARTLVRWQSVLAGG